MIYDEQVTTFRQSFSQRRRWTKGYLQILRHYGGKLIKAFFSGKGFSNFDMLMAISPALLLTTFAMAINVAVLVAALFVAAEQFLPILISVLITLGSTYVFFFFVGLVSGIAEWDQMGTTKGKKILSLLTFPAFMYTYLPIVAATLVSPKVEWKQIKHHAKK